MNTRTRIAVSAAICGLAMTTTGCSGSDTATTTSAPAASASVKGSTDVFLDDQFAVQSDCGLDANAQQLYFSAPITCPDLVMSNRYVLFQPEGVVDVSGAKLTSSRVAFAGGGDITLHGADMRRATITLGDLGSGTLDLTGANLSDVNLTSLNGNVTTDETTIFCHTKLPKTGKVNDRDC
ncbi:MAG: hypothetical protein NTX29_06310 [Actinobacteria bacterium]|nr:hypothetical protein [Actinomycetota bacterium]